MKGTARRATSTFSSGSHSLALIAVLKRMLRTVTVHGCRSSFRGSAESEVMPIRSPEPLS